jgi:hypothetical protein
LPKQIKYLVILFLPLLFFWAGITIELADYGNDPNYIYIANAAAICDGQGVGHIDNPGTTVMEIGALTMAVSHLFYNPENQTLVTHILKEPLFFVNAIHLVFVVLNAALLLLLGIVVLKKKHSVWVALLLQTLTFQSANTLDHVWTKVSPEPVLFAVTCLYVIAILYYYASENRWSLKYILSFALLAGAGLATKATFLPLVLIPLFLFPGLKKKIIYLLSVVLSFVIFTIPAIPQYKNMYYWFRNMLSHTGKYGQGEKGFLDLSTYFPNLLKIIQNNPVFGAVTIASLFALIVFVVLRKMDANRWKDKPEASILLGLTAANSFGILLVAKQYSADHYLIPVLLLSGISVFFIFKLLVKSEKIILPVLVCSLILYFSIIQPPKIKYAELGYRLTNEELISTQKIIDNNYSNYTKVYYYPYSMNKFSALNFGNVHTKHKLLSYLKEVYPNTYFYNYSHEIFQVWNAEISLLDIIKQNGNKILLVGGPRNNEGAQKMIRSNIPLKTVYQGRVQGIYELDSVKFNQMALQSDIRMIDEITCDAEKLSADNQVYLGSNNKSFGNAYNRTNEEARSGSHSIKMDAKTEYALYYELSDLKAGDTYEISIWRKADNNSGRLIVSAAADKSFYKSQHEYISTDNAGWNLIRIKAEVPQKLQNDTLKIYLWNPKGKLAYFDDLTITHYISTLTDVTN